MSGMKVVYEGEDIYPHVSVGRCWHDMNAWGALDELNISFGDTRDLWDGWSPKNGDTIEVIDGAARTGKMFVRDVRPYPSSMDLRAYPVPQSMREAKCRSWESVHLMQLARQIASEAGMELESYGVSDALYAYVEQRNESDLSFLNKRLTYEGAGMIAFDGKLVVFGGEWAESQEASKTLEITHAVDYEIEDNSTRAYGCCTVTDGATSATYGSEGRLLKRVIDDKLTDEGEAMRFARGLLWEANRGLAQIRISTDTMLRAYAPGSVVNVDASSAPSWNGKLLVTRLRHDYFDCKSKAWLARPIGG